MSKFGLGLIDWDITARCNMACSHCYAHGMYGECPPPDLSTDECLKLIDRIYEQHGAQLVLMYGGEPLLRPDLEQLAARITGYGANCGFVTNGTGLSPSRAADLHNAGVTTIAVSLDASTPETYHQFRGRNLFKQAVMGCRAAVDAGLNVSIGFVVSRANKADAAGALRLSLEIGAHSVIFTPLAYEGRARHSWTTWTDAVLTPVELVDMAVHLITTAISEGFPVDNIDLSFAPPPLINYISTKLHTAIPLPVRGCQPLSNLFIRADGSVFPCKGMVPGLTMKQAAKITTDLNLIHTPLMEILGSEDFSALFFLSGNNKIHQGLPPICHDCDYLSVLCQPCPLAAADSDRPYAEYCHDYPVSEICRESFRRLEVLS